MKLQDWLDFLTADPTTLSDDAIDQACADGYSPEWSACPVAALAPQVCEDFRRISTILANAYRADLSRAHNVEWERAYKTTPPLFKAACALGEALEKLQDARTERLGEDAERDAMQEARAAWTFVATLAGDAS